MYNTIQAFQHIPNSRYLQVLILGSGVPKKGDQYPELGLGDPKSRYRLKQKSRLFQDFKILKHSPYLYYEGVFVLDVFALDLIILIIIIY